MHLHRFSSTIDAASAFLVAKMAVSSRTANTNTNVRLYKKKTTVTTSRQDVFFDVIVVASAIMVFGRALSPSTAFALVTIPKDNEIIKELRTVTNKLDINNAAVADFMHRDVYTSKSNNAFLFSQEERSMIKKRMPNRSRRPSPQGWIRCAAGTWTAEHSINK